MTDMVILVSVTLSLIGAIVVTFQLFRIWRTLGTPFSGDMGTILTEHLLLGAMWVTGLMGWALIARFDLFSGDTRNVIAAGLGVAIMLIVWGFAIRAHLWYRNLKGH